MKPRAILAAGLLACCALPVCAEPAGVALRIVTEPSPPDTIVHEGKVSGNATDKIRAIMARTGTPYTLEVMPWKRAYLFASRERATCVYSTTRTPEREQQFKWVGPTTEVVWTLFGLAERHFALHELADARGLRIGTYLGDARDDYLRGLGHVVDAASVDAHNPAKLLLGRIDLWAVALRADTREPYQNRWPGKIVPVLTFRRLGVYLACNAGVPDALIARLNEALDAIKHDGLAQQIDARYASEQDQARAP